MIDISGAVNLHPQVELNSNIVKCCHLAITFLFVPDEKIGKKNSKTWVSRVLKYLQVKICESQFLSGIE